MSARNAFQATQLKTDLSYLQLHFNDPHAFHEIYGLGSKMTKFLPFYDGFHERQSSFGFVDPKLAKQRRDILSPLFSRRAILKLEGVIQHSVRRIFPIVAWIEMKQLHQIDRLVNALSAYAGPEGRPANLHLALHSTTMEIITSYCHANPFRALDAPNFDHPAVIAFLSTGGVFFLMQHFPFMAPLMFHLPDSLKSKEMAACELVFRKIAVQIDAILADPTLLEKAEHETIYHHLLSSENGRQPPSRRSLLDEGSVLVGAGSDTVANTCAYGIFCVLENPKIRTRLVEEIKEAWPEKDVTLGVQSLEKLPYLVGASLLLMLSVPC